MIKGIMEKNLGRRNVKSRKVRARAHPMANRIKSMRTLYSSIEPTPHAFYETSRSRALQTILLNLKSDAYAQYFCCVCVITNCARTSANSSLIRARLHAPTRGPSEPRRPARRSAWGSRPGRWRRSASSRHSSPSPARPDRRRGRPPPRSGGGSSTNPGEARARDADPVRLASRTGLAPALPGKPRLRSRRAAGRGDGGDLRPPRPGLPTCAGPGAGIGS